MNILAALGTFIWVGLGYGAAYVTLSGFSPALLVMIMWLDSRSCDGSDDAVMISAILGTWAVGFVLVTFLGGFSGVMMILYIIIFMVCLFQNFVLTLIVCIINGFIYELIN